MSEFRSPDHAPSPSGAATPSDRRHPRALTLSDLNDWRDGPLNRHHVVAIPTIWVALFVSLHFHAAMLWFWLPRLPHPSLDETEPGKAHTVLVARLTPVPTPVKESPPPASPPPSPPSPPRAAASPPSRSPPPTSIKRPPSSPPPASPIPAPSTRPVEPSAPPVAPPVAAPAPPRPPAETDLASYIEARRRARGDPPTQSTTPPSETESERKDRIIAANLASNQQKTFGYDPKTGGGLFQLKRVGYEDAEFYFTGWDKDISRRAKQLIEVRRGTNSDIRLAIVRKMISIVRDEVQGDFNWKSERLGREVVMSARPADNAVLEEFLMQEFFSDPRRVP